jgi:hypothetical protein
MRAHEVVRENFADGRQTRPPIVEYSVFDLHHELFETIARLDPKLFENHGAHDRLKTMLAKFGTPSPVIGQDYVYTSVASTPAAKFISVAQFDQPHELIDIRDDRYYFSIDGQMRAFPEQGGIDQRDSYQHVFMFDSTAQRDKMISWVILNHGSDAGWRISRKRISENFADGRKPGRRGLSKRVGVSQKMSIAKLKKIASTATGERRRMAQWNLNMKRGRQKK